jgi:hypothetical protein
LVNKTKSFFTTPPTSWGKAQLNVGTEGWRRIVKNFKIFHDFYILFQAENKFFPK